MKKTVILSVTLALLTATSLILAQTTGAQFAVLDVYIDSQDQALAAWQFELTDANNHMQVVGVESGEHGSFAKVPVYDRDVVDQGQAERIIVANFSLDSTQALPKGVSRIASIHVRVDGEPNYQLRLVNAGNADGVSIPATINFKKK